ncbi:hypothetical protein D0869_01303 [Hortaea werneckii]|uniref:Uncharacterized protein n=1 Tax=Hortaea werneckii TaxID=91943 RepID=A0A3M6YE29_HORWE|nr:hypothetical protein KC324_g628 [Hortaea werneckii]RMX88861.1 hypothetical protein D0869_01303 [Hortaea werneckii]RMY01314.1 hypothetical protein D0868_08550 [Hortaea werneckii]RMY23243.1 hypothetical protein D0867_02174 [Hortaea werneckii]RMY38018.1 hypothetical protein D0866_02885 [Hortaea werneckii]
MSNIATSCFPSPALSACDSLAGSEDLDAFLDAQGPLSQFGTPPPSKMAANMEVMELVEEEDEDELVEDVVALDYSHIARLFAEKSYTSSSSPTAWETEHILDMLTNAKLPAEIIALSYNVVCTYDAMQRFRAEPRSADAGDLLVVSAMSLAVMSASDNPPKSAWWSVIVCNGIRSASEIDTATIDLLAALDWTLHSLCSPKAIEQAMDLLTSPAPSQEPLTAQQEEKPPRPQTPVNKVEPLKISLEGTGASWSHGQLTPDSTAPSSAAEERGKDRFLPLL